MATRPRLWPVGLRQLRRLAVPGWWRRPPFLPLPDRAYLGFRMETMYGDPGHRLEPGDVVAWLEWCAAFDDRTRSAAGAGTSSRSRRR